MTKKNKSCFKRGDIEIVMKGLKSEDSETVRIGFIIGGLEIISMSFKIGN